MKKILLSLLFCFLLIGCTSLNPEDGKIEVTGKGCVIAKPDIAVFSISINTLEDSTSAAATKLKDLQNSVLKILVEDCSVLEDDIVSTSLYFSPSYSYVDGKQVLNGQQASSTYSVTIRDLEAIGSIYDKLSQISSITLSNISLQVEDDSEYIIKAREKAVEDAISIATIYANRLGLKLGKAIFVSESNSYSNYGESIAFAPKSMMANSDGINYRENDIEIRANVNVAFVLQ